MAVDTFSDPTLPYYCQPTHPFLVYLSQVFSTCIPTPLSLISSSLGLLSMCSWLFAQLPQIYKNYQNQSVEGLSIIFLLNWLLGDVCNMVGAILLNQMFFQKAVGGYYVVVDVALMLQWIWYGVLVERSKRKEYEYLEDKVGSGSNSGGSIIEGISPPGSRDYGGSAKVVEIKNGEKSRYDTSFPGTPVVETPDVGTPGSSRWNLGSGKSTVQTMFVLVTLFAFAVADHEQTSAHISSRRIAVSPLGKPLGIMRTSAMEGWLTKEFVGGVIAWASTMLYCSSRIPQLLKNYSRRSCSGLSITLFVAAFFGNLFYSISLLSNPLAWGDYEPYGGGGLAGPEGSNAKDWWKNALPFFLGASGVLCQDGMVFCQFLMWGDGKPVEGEEVDDAEETLLPDQGRLSSPWMRFTPTISIEVKIDEERSGLLDCPEEWSSSGPGQERIGNRITYGTLS